MDTPYDTDITRGSEIRTNFNRFIFGDLGAEGEWVYSTADKRASQKFRIEGNGSLMENSAIYYHPLLETFDTSANRETRATGHTYYSLYFEKHLSILRGWPFWGVEGTVSVSGEDYRNNHYRSRNNYAVYLNENVRTVERRCMSSGIVKPTAGLNKRKPVLPVYQAFEIERILKKTGEISGSLTDSTLFALIALNASIRSYSLKHERHWKYYMKKLEQILSEDPNLFDSTLDAFSLFKIYETFSTRLPGLFCGPSAALQVFNRGDGYYYSDKSDTGDTWFDATYDAGLYTILQWTYPVFPRLFLSVLFQRPLVYSSQSDKLLGNPDLRTRIRGEAHCFATNRFLLECGIETWKLMDEFHLEGFFEARLYLEDHLSIVCSMQKTFSNRKKTEKDLNIDMKSEHERITLGLGYDW